MKVLIPILYILNPKPYMYFGVVKNNQKLFKY